MSKRICVLGFLFFFVVCPTASWAVLQSGGDSGGLASADKHSSEIISAYDKAAGATSSNAPVSSPSQQPPVAPATSDPYEMGYKKVMPATVTPSFISKLTPHANSASSNPKNGGPSDDPDSQIFYTMDQIQKKSK